AGLDITFCGLPTIFHVMNRTQILWYSQEISKIVLDTRNCLCEYSHMTTLAIRSTSMAIWGPPSNRPTMGGLQVVKSPSGMAAALAEPDVRFRAGALRHLRSPVLSSMEHTRFCLLRGCRGERQLAPLQGLPYGPAPCFGGLECVGLRCSAGR